ncbi:hypothetical protein TUM19329_28240 [Legionella antarctica]|uniref:DUF541 domain-containing protein n=1 Tax=Legionella antarctica TaxID=2708020 RepID=A0A6F8T8C9_9GAMM|nr:hypothetical protein [Legionella antarctica]BCA96463.1 hypothetical protein TUM19329_28240 [Legionella antarctica]
MKKVVGMLALMTITPFAFAADILVPQMVLDKVLFQISSKKWVTTQTALLTVSINATLSNADLVKARADMMTSLNKIAKGDWHLIDFNRSQDSSGLEKLYVQARVRVDQATLTDIYQHAKIISTPGTKYEVSGVDFKPSLEETQTVRAKIREQLYQQVNEEIARMNKVYPTQNYSVSNLVFIEGGDNAPQPPRAYQAKEMNTMVMTAAASPAVTVSNELIMTAVVEAASNRTEASSKSTAPINTTKAANATRVTG